FLRGSFRQSCNSILRCPSISDGRLSYQFSSDGYIRRSVYAYFTEDDQGTYSRLVIRNAEGQLRW
ncbi:hypothetical protein CDL41_08080, partial [Escherichia coli]